MGFFDKLKKINIFSGFGSELTDDFYDELEESLILADTGMDVTLELVEELRRRGVDRALWDAALEEMPEAAEALDKLIRKTCRGDLSDPREKKRVSDALLRRGFGWSEVRAAMGRYTEMLEDAYD